MGCDALDALLPLLIVHLLVDRWNLPVSSNAAFTSLRVASVLTPVFLRMNETIASYIAPDISARSAIKSSRLSGLGGESHVPSSASLINSFCDLIKWRICTTDAWPAPPLTCSAASR